MDIKYSRNDYQKNCMDHSEEDMSHCWSVKGQLALGFCCRPSSGWPSAWVVMGCEQSGTSTDQLYRIKQDNSEKHMEQTAVDKFAPGVTQLCQQWKVIRNCYYQNNYGPEHQ